MSLEAKPRMAMKLDKESWAEHFSVTCLKAAIHASPADDKKGSMHQTPRDIRDRLMFVQI
jgi:hypothetical protein